MDILNDLKLQKNTKIEFAPTDDTFFDNSGSIYADSIAAGNIHIVSADNGTLGCSGIFIESGSNIELNIAGGNTNEGSFVINKGDTNNIFSITAHNSQNCVDYSGEPDTLIIKSNLKNINIESLSEFGDGEISLKNPSKISLKAPTIYISESCNDVVVIPGRINSGHGDLEIDSTSHLNEGLEVYGGHCSGEPNISATFDKGISVGEGIDVCTDPSAKFYTPVIIGDKIRFENLVNGKNACRSIEGIKLITFENGGGIEGLSNLDVTEFSVRKIYSGIKINTDDTNHIAQIEFTGLGGSKTQTGKIFIDDKQFGLESSADLFFKTHYTKNSPAAATEYVLNNGAYMSGEAFDPSTINYIEKIFAGCSNRSYTASNNKIYKEDQVIATIGYTNKLICNIFNSSTEFSIVEHFEPFVRNAAKNKRSDMKPTNSLNITKFTEFVIPQLTATNNKATHIESLQQMFINGFVFEDNSNTSLNERYCKVVQAYGSKDGLMAPMVQVFGYDDKCRITQKQVDTFFCKTTGELEIQIGTVSDVPAGCLFAKVFI